MTEPIKYLEDYPSYCKMAAIIYQDLSLEISNKLVNLPVTSNHPTDLDDAIKDVTARHSLELLRDVLIDRAYQLQEKGENP